MLLGVLGTVIGIVISLAAIYALNIWPASPSSSASSRAWCSTPSIAAGGRIVSIALIVIGIAVLGSLQPAWKAARMDPITALRHV